MVVEWPMELVIAAWSPSAINPTTQFGYVGAYMLQWVWASANESLHLQGCTRLSAATITLLRDLLNTLQTECQDCSARADKKRRRSKSFPFSLSEGLLGWRDCSCMLKVDPHIAETYFHAHHEVTRLKIALNSRFASSYEKGSHPKCAFITTASWQLCISFVLC